MNKKNFISEVAESTGMTKKEAGIAVQAFMDTIMKAVANGDPVQFQGFGTFKVVDRAARTGHNPQTGEAIQIPACRVPKFVPGKGFKDIVK